MDATQTHLVHDLEHDSPLISCRFDPTGEFLFAGAQDFRVWRWRIESGEKTEAPVESWVRGLCFAEGGGTLITGGTDGRLIWWPAAADTLEPVRIVEAHDGWIRAVAASPDGATIASAGNDLKVRLWNASDGRLLHELEGHESHIYNLAFHPEGTHLVSGDLMTNLIDWAVAPGKKARTWKAESLVKYDKTFLANIGGFRGMAFSPDGNRLAGCGITNVTNAFAGVGNPLVTIFDWESGELVIEQVTRKKLRGVAWGVALHPDGTTIAAVGGQGGYLLFWQPEEDEEFHQIKLKDNARDLDLSPDGLHVATAHHDGHARIHRMTAAGEKDKPAS